MIFMDVDAALAEVPVNAMPLLDDTDFKSIEASVAYNAGGMALYWHFVTSAGVETTTAVTPTTAGTYDWAHAGQGMYTIEIPASGGASINNDTEGYGYFTGVATGVLPWRGPTIGFRASGLNDALCDSAYSTTRGLAGTALPNAAADAAGGLPISDAGGLDLDAKIGALTYGTANRVNVQVYGLEANVLTAASTAGDYVTEIQTAITGGAYNLDTDANGRIRIVDGTGTGELDTSSGAVLVYDFTTAAKALLQAEAEDAIVTHRLDELLNADSDIDGAAPPTVGSVFHELLSKTAGSFTFDQTTDSLEALRDRGDAAWITATGFSTLDAAGVRTAVGLASANLDTQLDALPTANEVRNAVTGGAYALSTDSNGMVRIVDGTGTGELDTLSGTVLLRSATEAQIDAIEADTNELQTDWTNGGRLDLLLDAILDDTGTSGVVVASGSKTGYALTSGERDSIAAAHLDLANGIETSVSPRQATRAIAAILAGIVSGAGLGTEVFKGIGQASGGTTRVIVTVDGSGNRSAMTLNL